MRDILLPLFGLALYSQPVLTSLPIISFLPCFFFLRMAFFLFPPPPPPPPPHQTPPPSPLFTFSQCSSAAGYERRRGDQQTTAQADHSQVKLLTSSLRPLLGALLSLLSLSLECTWPSLVMARPPSVSASLVLDASLSRW